MGLISPEQEKENEREIWLSHLRAVSGQLKSKVSLISLLICSLITVLL